MGNEYGRDYYDDGYGCFDPYTGAPSRSMYAGMARKSQAAQRREDAAHAAFVKLSLVPPHAGGS